MAQKNSAPPENEGKGNGRLKLRWLAGFSLVGLVSCAVPVSSSASLAVGSASPSPSAPFTQPPVTSEVDFPSVNARLIPLSSAPNAVPIATAFDAIQTPIETVSAGNSAGSIVGGLYSYYNSVYGQIQSDGSVKLTYQGTPVYMFTAPLLHYVNDSPDQGGPPSGASPKAQPTLTGCSYIYIVDATTATPLTWWQNCTGN